MKNNLKKVISLFLVLLLVIVLVPTTVSATTIKLNKNKVSLEVGKSSTLKVNGTKKVVKWSTSNKKIVTVNSNGKITAKKYGTATITATVGGSSYTCKVTTKYDKDSMLMDAYNWVVSDLWNDSFCDIYHYVEDGRNAVGREMDIQTSIENADKAIKKSDLYDDFINSLNKKDYKELKSKWDDIRNEIDMLYARIKEETPRAADETYIFDKDNFNTYMYDLMSLFF